MGSISASDRKLIDEAIAAGKVQHIEPGVRAINTDLIWSEEKNRIVYVDPDAAYIAKIEGLRFGNPANQNPLIVKRIRKKDPAVAERRARVRVLIEQNMGGAEIHETLKAEGYVCSMNVVYADAAKIGMSVPRKQKPRVTPDAITERRAMIKRLCADGLSVAEIARQTGIARKTIYDDTEALKITPIKGRPGPRADSPAVVKARNRKREVAAMLADGVAIAEIARRTGFSRKTIQNDADELGMRSHAIAAE